MENSSCDSILITVLTTVYNCESTIVRTIESVLNQTYNNIEYIIIDGCSTDKTLEKARSYQELFDKTEGRSLKIISEKDNGMYDALNKGVNASSGVLIGSINADDWYEPEAVEKMVCFYEKKHYDVAWGDLRIIKPTGNIIKKAKVGKVWTTTGWCHPSMFAKRELLLEIPYACENMYDDFNFITSAHIAGKRICTLNETISNFSFGGMSTQKNLKDTFERIKIKYSIYRKHNMSRLYWLHCFSMEMAKYILG
ncbi:MAG: glycosyltransferase [Clostridia bacterium]|nr:glycosyltransferase [Clostridia bacterium]